MRLEYYIKLIKKDLGLDVYLISYSIANFYILRCGKKW